MGFLPLRIHKFGLRGRFIWIFGVKNPHFWPIKCLYFRGFNTKNVDFFGCQNGDFRAKICPRTLQKGGSDPPKGGNFDPPRGGSVIWQFGTVPDPPKRWSGPPQNWFFGPPRPGSPVWGGPINHITPTIEPGLGVQKPGIPSRRPENLVRI